MPLFSIIVPVYNVAPYLRECLDSIFSQNFENYEVCIVDDGSTDGSADICDEYQTRYRDNTKLVHQQNQGVSVARNVALDMAEGKYIWFVDADDYILPHSLSYLAKVIRESGCDTIFFGSTPLNDSDYTIPTIQNKAEYLSNHLCFCNPLMIFSRDLIRNKHLRFTQGVKMGEDLEFQYKYLIWAQRIVEVPFNFYVIRQREGSASRSLIAKENNVIGCEALLNNLLLYIQNNPTDSINWLAPRINERLKSYVRDTLSLNGCKQFDIKRHIRHWIAEYSQMGISSIKDTGLRLISLSPRLYQSCVNLLLKMK